MAITDRNPTRLSGNQTWCELSHYDSLTRDSDKNRIKVEAGRNLDVVFYEGLNVILQSTTTVFLSSCRSVAIRKQLIVHIDYSDVACVISPLEFRLEEDLFRIL